jgi:hypothetical protein
MKKIIREILVYGGILLAALLLSFDDFAYPADWSQECSEIVRISDLMETPMGRTIVQISVNTTGKYYGVDTSCANFAWCVSKLFDLYPNVLRVEIMNDPLDWVPSRWRSIDLCHSRLLNEAWEEYGEYQTSDDFLEACYETQYPDMFGNWRD